MKTITALLIAIAVITMMNVQAVQAGNVLYTGGISTFTATNAYAGADIDLPSVKVLSMSISNPTALAMTVTVYELGDDTNTITAVATVCIPAAIGNYPVYELSGNSTAFGNKDLVDVPRLTVRSSSNTATGTAAAKVNVKYQE